MGASRGREAKMKFSVLKENFSSGLSKVGKAVATKGSLPILSNILLATDEGRLKLAATDLETGVVSWVGSKIDREGGITVPARLISEFVSNLGPVQLEGSAENTILTLVADKARSVLNGVPAEEFPALPKRSDNYLLKISPKDFSNAVSEVSFAVAADEGRPILTGVLVNVDGDEMTLVGVDGFRLAERKLKLSEKVPEPISLVIPARALNEIVRLVAGEEPIKISLLPEGNQILFDAGDSLVFSRILEGQFPDYKKIIPSEFATEAVALREELLNAVRLASVFARDSASIVRLRLAENQISLLSTTAEVGEGEMKVDAEVTGPDLEISFNSRYLVDVLSNVKGEKVIFAGSDGLSAGLLRLPDRADYLHLVMPVRVQQ